METTQRDQKLNRFPALKRYYGWRDSIKSGDQILYQGQGRISRLIRLFTPYSHISPVVYGPAGFEDRVFIAEATAGPGCSSLLSERLTVSHSRAYWCRLTPELDEYREALARAYWEMTGFNYDYGGLIENIRRLIPEDPEKMICSEYTQVGFKRAVPAEVLRRWLRPPFNDKNLKKMMEGKVLRPGHFADICLLKKPVLIYDPEENHEH
jgi:hypothetical protein